MDLGRARPRALGGLGVAALERLGDLLERQRDLVQQGRGAVRAIAQGDNVPPPVPEALRELADAVRRLEATLDEGGDETAVREPALRAAARATLVLEQTANLSVSLIVVQVRATAVDLLRGSGLDREEAERQVREAARLLR